eukprot:Pgem_evm1s51
MCTVLLSSIKADMAVHFVEGKVTAKNTLLSNNFFIISVQQLEKLKLKNLESRMFSSVDLGM